MLFPGSIAIADLVSAVRRIASRSAKLQADFGEALKDDAAFAAFAGAKSN